MDTNLDLLTASLSGSCDYEGEVNVQILDGKKEIYSKKFHNTGKPNLFKFFANCLLGNWSLVKDQIPCKIILFNKAANEQPDSKFSSTYWNKDLALSPAVYYDTVGYATPIEEEISGSSDKEIIGYKTTLHFRIPFTYIFSNATNGIYKVGLYPEVITDYADELCAYYKFVDSNKIWDPINVPANANNYTVIVNWTLKIMNKVVSK